MSWIPSEHFWETLQQYKTLHVIKMDLVKKCPEIAARIAELVVRGMESYEQFGECLKLETHKDSHTCAKIAGRFELNTSKSGNMSSSA